MKGTLIESFDLVSDGRREEAWNIGLGLEVSTLDVAPLSTV